MFRALHQNYNPNKVVLFRTADSNFTDISQFAEFTKDQKTIEGKATAYVCRNYACHAPTSNVKEMIKLMRVKE